MTSRTAQKRKRTTPTSDETVDPLEKALRKPGPRCECKHTSGRCRRRATHRVSAICAEVGCRNAAHVSILCATCKDDWVHHSAHCSHCPELRVARL
jgi:hypothetical protein